jgi:hypothetical protein
MVALGHIVRTNLNAYVDQLDNPHIYQEYNEDDLYREYNEDDLNYVQPTNGVWYLVDNMAVFMVAYPY